MKQPEFVMVAGCNAAGKSSFIRSRINELWGFEIIMTDVYKNRTKEVFREALRQRKDIILETVFNDPSFREMADDAALAGYHTSLVVLFLDNPKQSSERVAFRTLQQSGLIISGENVRLNFNESFKNVATYFFYFDQADFIYTGITNENLPVMRFERSLLTAYQASELVYPQKFAQFALRHERLNHDAHDIITTNKNYQYYPKELKQNNRRKPGRKFRL